MVFAYLGPETMLPMTSVIAGAIGFFMMFGRKVVDIALLPFRKKSPAVAPQTRARGHRPTASRNATPAPHLAGVEVAEKAESKSA